MNRPLTEQPQFQVGDFVQDRSEREEFFVHRNLFTDPDIFNLEMERIFAGTWIFIAHESQVPENHDFFTTTIGKHPIILTRNGQGKLKAYINACSHRGATLERVRRGSSQFFTCPYHGWVFDTDGQCLQVTDQEDGQYPKGFVSQDRSLKGVPKLESYHGMVFASLNPDVHSLEEHLGDARIFIDLVLDQGENGMEVVKGSSNYTHRGNWKLQPENGIDGYHFTAVHGNYVGLMQRKMPKGKQAEVKRAIDGDSILKMDSGWYDLGHGHTVMWATFSAAHNRPSYPRYEALVKQYGKSKADWMVHRVRNFLIYPNLLFMDHASTQLRVIKPVSVDKTQVEMFCLAAKGEPADQRRNRMRQFEDFFNATGLATPDDLNVFEACHDGLVSDYVEWQQNYDRGFSTLRRGGDRFGDEIGVQPIASGPNFRDETLLHGQYREWKRLMSGE